MIPVGHHHPAARRRGAVDPFVRCARMVLGGRAILLVHREVPLSEVERVGFSPRVLCSWNLASPQTWVWYPFVVLSGEVFALMHPDRLGVGGAILHDPIAGQRWPGWVNPLLGDRLYLPDQVREMVRRTGHHGPWETTSTTVG